MEYGYDETGKLLSQTEVINGTTHTTSYEYDDDNRVTAKTTDGITVEYTYDGLGRITQQVTKNGDTTVKTETYTFTANSAQVHTYRTQAGSYDVTYTYTYDDNGNILTVNDGTTTTSYVYDSANQLIEAYDTDLEYAWFWTYDNAGNIQSAVLRDYTQCVVDAVLSSHSYTYGDEEWGDLLTAFDDTAIAYDGIGNPTSYRGYTLTWEHGRQLASMSQNGQTWEFTYDANGMRTGRKMEYGNQSYSYVYNGDQLVEMDANGIALKFTYDAEGTPLTLQAGNDLYYYVTNLQGDVTGILDTNGNLVASYIYDAWGRILYMSGSGVVGYNPLTYRGYVYDHGTGLYYLQSRYYDPIAGRFLNADAFASTGQGFTGNNMFAYCGNNPVNRADPTGHGWIEDLIEDIADYLFGGLYLLAGEVAQGTVLCAEQITHRTAPCVPSAPQLDSNVLKLTGSHLAQKRMTQTVAVNGKTGDYYTLAGWAMGDSAPLESTDTNPREFAIQAVLVYTDGTQSAPFTARFNPDSANWQYTAKTGDGTVS